MATTSPNNIRTPDLTDPYNPVPDLAQMAGDVQSALIQRANAYKGTSAQRTAFTSQAEDGVLWQDTNGDRQIWVKHGPSNTWQAPTANRPIIRGGRFIPSGISVGANSEETFPFTFPDPFPAAPNPVLISNSGSSRIIYRPSSLTSSGFTVHARNVTGAATNTLSFYWTAILF